MTTLDELQKIAQAGGRDPLVDELMADNAGASNTVESKRLSLGDVISLGVDTEGGDIKQAVTVLEESKLRLIFETKTGGPSYVNKNVFPPAMRRVWPDGVPMYTLTPPVNADGVLLSRIPARFPCMLNEVHPSFEIHKGWGAIPMRGTCRKRLATEMDMQLHMEKIHPFELAVIMRSATTQKQAQTEKEQREYNQSIKDLVTAFVAQKDIGASDSLTEK